MSSLAVSGIVVVSVSTSPQPIAARGFGTKLIQGTGAVLPLEERVRTYTQLIGGVDADFVSTTQEYKAAASHFNQPNARPLKIGRQFTAAQAGKLRGGTVSDVYTDYTGITSGGFDIVIDGVLKQVSGINLSSATSMTTVASAIQTRVQVALAATTFTWNATRKCFVLGSPTTGASSSAGYAAAPTAAGPPSDQSATFGLTALVGALSVNGIAAESVTDALTANRGFDKTWYGLEMTSTTAQDVKDAMAFCESAKLLFFYSSPDANIKSAVATSDLAYYAKNLGYDRSSVFFDDVNSDHYLSGSGMSRMFAVDYDQPGAFTTLKFKKAPGYAPVSITESERIAIIGDLQNGVKGKNANIYADYGGFTMFSEGTVASGRFIDEIIGLDWLAANIESNYFNALATSPTSLPQTDAGARVLVTAVEQALEKGRNFGLLAPGFWTGPNVGEIKTGDFLPKGYYAFAQPVVQQSSADRALRKAPPLTAIGIGAGAIHSGAIGFTFQR